MSVQEFRGENAVEEVVLSNGSIIKADLVFLNIGAKPDTVLAKRAKLDITPRGNISIDSFMYTSHPDVLAIGDCASKVDFFTGKESGIMLASVAAREGRIAACNLFNRNFQVKPFGVVSIFSTCIDGVYFGSAGLSEEAAKKSGYRCSAINVEAPDKHPKALPDTKQLKAVFIFDQETGLLLGAQLIGGVQVAEIANIIGFAIQERNTAHQILGKVYGTHPLATSSPNHYIIHVAAREMVKVLGKLNE
jgi:NADH oxidase (H2O2-forming)